MIQKRKSVRSIDARPLKDDVLSDILNFAHSAAPLYPDIAVSIRLLTHDQVKSMGAVFAPHYLAFYGERNQKADTNCGFILQQADLYLSSLGLGSCWLGMAKPMEKEFEGRPFGIMLAFGTPKESLYRNSIDQFKRKAIEEISSGTVPPEYIEAVRLAPSAMNKQPWFFSGDEHHLHAFSLRSPLNPAARFRFIDMGIALSQAYVTAVADGKTVEFTEDPSAVSEKGKEYVLSLTF